MVFMSEKSLPVVAVREGIVLPGTENVLIFGRSKSTQAINEALKRDKKLILVMQKTPTVDNPAIEELYEIGVVVMIKNVVHGDKGEINALVRGIEKVRIEDYTREEPYFEASYKELQENVIDDEEIRGFIRYISTQVKKAINLGKTIDFTF